MGIARNYILNISEIMSCGIGTYTGLTYQKSILNPFTATTNNTTCSYSSLSVDNLKSLPTIEYNKRVLDFINTLEIETNLIKENLYNLSTFVNNDCDLICNLNSDFIIYKFLTGIRIVNVGQSIGTIQYKVYPLTGDSNNYVWQTNPTFLDLDQNIIYNVEIRDFYNNIEICKYSKTISLSLLIPSTTIILPNRTISLNQTSYINNPTLQTKTGCIKITPSFVNGERVLIDYDVNLNILGNAESSILFTCKPNNCSIYSNYVSIINSCGSKITGGTLSLLYGDTICYNITAINNGYGSNAIANFSLTNANGLCSINPIIDITNCSTQVNSCLPQLDIMVSLSGNTINSNTPQNTTINGVLNFSNQIPNNEYIDIHLCNLNSVNGTNTSTSTFYRKRSTDSNYLQYYVSDKNCTQPDNPIIRAEYGDKFCYNMVLTTPNYGDNSNGVINICDLVGSIGINPTINTNICGNTLSCNKSLTPLSKIVSICRTNEYMISGTKKSNGVLNINPILSAGQSINVNYDIQQRSTGCCYSNNQIQIYCKPFNSSSYVLKNTYYSEIDGITCNYLVCNTSGSFVYNYGDDIYYTNSSIGMYETCSSIILTSVSDGSSITPSICLSKNSDILNC
jgi:hypothetical protein